MRQTLKVRTATWCGIPESTNSEPAYCPTDDEVNETFGAALER